MAALAPFGHELPVNGIGWYDETGNGAYILGSVTRRRVEDIIGHDGLNGISNSTLYTQLEEKGYMIRVPGKEATFVKSIGGKSRRVVYLSGKAVLDD